MSTNLPQSCEALFATSGSRPGLAKSNALEQCKRIGVELDSATRQVKIRLERYDESLQWYCSGSIDLPLHQLPLLEQALEEMRVRQAGEEANKIIPFPGA